MSEQMSDKVTREYRKKPVVVEAVQFDGNNFDECVEFAKSDDGIGYPNWIGGPHAFMIPTPEDAIIVSKGDWVIKGGKGEFYPCKPDIFEATYEPADQQSAPAPEVETVAWMGIFPESKISRALHYERPDESALRVGERVDALVRRSDMETALAAKERECEQLRGELKIQDDANDLLTTIRDNQALIIRKLHKETLTLRAENEKLRGVVEAAQSEEIREALTVGITELTTWLAEGCDCPAEGHICGRHRLDVSINKLRAALSKGESHE